MKKINVLKQADIFYNLTKSSQQLGITDKFNTLLNMLKDFHNKTRLENPGLVKAIDALSVSIKNNLSQINKLDSNQVKNYLEQNINGLSQYLNSLGPESKTELQNILTYMSELKNVKQEKSFEVHPTKPRNLKVQKDLNIILKDQGQKPIKEDGIWGNETQKALEWATATLNVANDTSYNDLFEIISNNAEMIKQRSNKEFAPIDMSHLQKAQEVAKKANNLNNKIKKLSEIIDLSKKLKNKYGSDIK